MLLLEKLEKFLEFSCSTNEVGSMITPYKRRFSPTSHETSQTSNETYRGKIRH
jgi:hypothetical protein